MEHRKRNQNWTAEENEVFEKALQKYGRGNVASIFAFLQDNIDDFSRTERDVKKKVYNFLQENIAHEASVKVRTQLCYAILSLYRQETQKALSEDDDIVQRVSQLTKHAPKRVLKNFADLQQDPNPLALSCGVVANYIAAHSATFGQLFESQTYLELLTIYSQTLDSD